MLFHCDLISDIATSLCNFKTTEKFKTIRKNTIFLESSHIVKLIMFVNNDLP